MMQAMFNQLRENQEKMSNSLEEKLKENQFELIKSQENLKISMNNSLKDHSFLVFVCVCPFRDLFNSW